MPPLSHETIVAKPRSPQRLTRGLGVAPAAQPHKALRGSPRRPLRNTAPQFNHPIELAGSEKAGWHTTRDASGSREPRKGREPSLLRPTGAIGIAPRRFQKLKS